jgi:hypothetical protein
VLSRAPVACFLSHSRAADDPTRQAASRPEALPSSPQLQLTIANMDRQFAGPQIPAHILAKRKREQQEEEEAAKTVPAVTSPRESSEDDITIKKKRISGPAPPPAPLEERPEGSPSDDSGGESSSDDDFGPAPPAASRTEVRRGARCTHPILSQLMFCRKKRNAKLNGD